MTKTDTLPLQDAPLPLFYKNVRPLDRHQDTHLKIKRVQNYNFAKGTNAIPLTAEEMGSAAVSYPIVFAGAPISVPAMVVGINNDENVFIDAKGQWQADSYIPAYVRRYPFILMEGKTEAEPLALCFDAASNIIGTEGELPLFDNKEPTETLQQAIRFCTNMRSQAQFTTEFVTGLQQHNLLVPQQAKFTLPNGKEASLAGFQMIDTDRFQKLPDTLLGEWHRRGWLALIYAHLLSNQNWQKLLGMLATRTAA